ncbi:hypothetical protein ABK040_012336 [Willaertia magna]
MQKQYMPNDFHFKNEKLFLLNSQNKYFHIKHDLKITHMTSLGTVLCFANENNEIFKATSIGIDNISKGIIPSKIKIKFFISGYDDIYVVLENNKIFSARTRSFTFSKKFTIFKCDYINTLHEIKNELKDEDKMDILSQCQLLIVPPNYAPLSDRVVQYIKDLIDTNRIACVFLRGITQDQPLTDRLGYLNNGGYVDWGFCSTFQINYKILSQQAELTKSFYLSQFLQEYGEEIKEFYETIKPEEATDIPMKIAPLGIYCTGLPQKHLTEPEKWICFATNHTDQTLRCAILIHKEKKVLFNHWYAIETKEPPKFSKDLMSTMINYVVFDLIKEKELLKDKLKVRIEDLKLSDIEIQLY